MGGASTVEAAWAAAPNLARAARVRAECSGLSPLFGVGGGAPSGAGPGTDAWTGAAAGVPSGAGPGADTRTGTGAVGGAPPGTPTGSPAGAGEGALSGSGPDPRAPSGPIVHSALLGTRSDVPPRLTSARTRGTPRTGVTSSSLATTVQVGARIATRCRTSSLVMPAR